MADLPALAIECIALHLAGSRGSNSERPDPRRTVLPLVCKAWQRALALAPAELREQVSISNADFDLGCSSSGASTGTRSTLAEQCPAATSSTYLAMCSWFAARRGQVRQLSVRLRWTPRLGRVSALERALGDVLASCAPSLERLHLEVSGAPLLTARLWQRLVETTAGPGCPGSKLCDLVLCLEARKGCSEASTARLALNVLELAALQPRLERLSVCLRGIKLLGLPSSLGSLPALSCLSLHFDPQAPTLPLPSAASFARGLPATLRTLELSYPPFQPAAALALPAKLPLLQRFVLVC